MDSLKDLLSQKADDIDDSGIVSDLQLVQKELDRYYESAASVQKIDDGVATITTKSSSVASELRLQQHQIIEALNSSLQNKLTKLYIRIR